MLNIYYAILNASKKLIFDGGRFSINNSRQRTWRHNIMKKLFLFVSAVLFFAILIFVIWTKLFYVKVNVALEPKIVVQNEIGIHVDSPKPQEGITSPLKISGSINGAGWSGFEGQVGTVTLVDSNNKTLAQTFLPATTDWMKLPTSFEATLNFVAPKSGSGMLIFKNENASGDPVRDKTFKLPVNFK
jgi:hypothetical protein